MVTFLKKYINRHRKGLFITSTLAGASYLSAKYAISKLKGLQEKATCEKLTNENLKRRFQQNQNDCTFTIAALLPTLEQEILKELDIEAEWEKLRKSRDLEKKIKKEQELKDSVVSLDSSVESIPAVNRSDYSSILSRNQKQAIWEDIKIKSFMRTLTFLYCTALLTLLSYIQLNLLGKLTYIWSVCNIGKKEPENQPQQTDEGYIDPQVERMFLSSSWWLLHRGWKKCAQRVQKAVENKVSSIALRSTLSYYDIQDLIQDIRQGIEYRDCSALPISYLDWMLPDTEDEEREFLEELGFKIEKETSIVALKRLLDETKDYIDRQVEGDDDFTRVFNVCLDDIFATFDHNTFAKSLLPNLEAGASCITEVSQEEAEAIEQRKTLTFANILPIMSRGHENISERESINEFTNNRELQMFSAMIYTQYDQ